MHGWIAAVLNLLGLGGSGSTVEPPGTVAGVWRVPAGGRKWVDRCTARRWRVPALGRVWRCGAMTFSGIIEKTPGDRVWLVFNFGDAPELRGATPATLGGPTIPAVSGITISGVALFGTYGVGAWYSGGTDGTSYDVTCTVTMSDTTVLERTGTLKVAKKST